MVDAGELEFRPEDPVIRGSTDWYAREFSLADLNLDQHKAQILDNAVSDILKNKARYQTVERSTNVPWYLVSCLHSRESSLDFSTYLGNGQPLSKTTTLVPSGRGPFSSWESGCVDALEYDGLSGRNGWSIALSLQLAEKYNGMGYFRRGHMSPYLWSFTSLYSMGKFGSDGHYNEFLVDQQPGVAALLKEMQSRGLI